MMKIKNMIFATVCCACLAVTGCNGNEAKESISASDTTATYQQISQDEAKKMMDEEEIKAVIGEVVSGLGIDAPTAKDKGRIMKELMPKVKGKADGKLVNQILMSILQ